MFIVLYESRHYGWVAQGASRRQCQHLLRDETDVYYCIDVGDLHGKIVINLDDYDPSMIDKYIPNTNPIAPYMVVDLDDMTIEEC